MSEVGDIIQFGKYYVKEGLKAPIDWLVIKKVPGKIGVITLNLIEKREFDENVYQIGKTNWGISTIRQWLNIYFYGVAFNEKERSMIQTAQVGSGEDHNNCPPSVKPVKDKIFLLSVTEARRLLNKKEWVCAQPTEYAANKSSPDEQEDSNLYWLRSPGANWPDTCFAGDDRFESMYPDCVNTDGEESSAGYIYIRPAMWISTED